MQSKFIARIENITNNFDLFQNVLQSKNTIFYNGAFFIKNYPQPLKNN